MLNIFQRVNVILRFNLITLKSIVTCPKKNILRTSALCTKVHSELSINEHLKEIFAFKNSNISNWIIENKARTLCYRYVESEKEEKQYILRTLAKYYAVQHDDVYEGAKKICHTTTNNERQIIVRENNLKNVLIPAYQWLFVIIGRLEHGVKFLVDLRTDVLELLTELIDTNEHIIIQQLNITLRDLLLLWFSVGFLHMKRITWQSSCDILQKVSNYEAIHPIKNWMDLKRRVGPYRRCYVFTHPSMPREPLVVLHTALCDAIPDSVKGIEEAEYRILGKPQRHVTFLEEDKSKIAAAIFYSVASTQKGLQGIELSNYLIKEVANEIVKEFPMIHRFCTLSPIPNFRLWFLEKVKQDINQVFTSEECEAIKRTLNSNDILINLKKIFSTSLWTNNTELSELLEKPLLRTCAWYLCREKRRNYALNNVANFHLRNGAVMWRINWLADPSPRGAANSCGIMVNYRYYLDDCENNSRNYIENYSIKTSNDVNELVVEAEKLRTKVL